MNKLIDALHSQEAEDAQERMSNESGAEKVDTRVLAKILYDRGVKIEDIFAVYYELEEAGNGRSMDVEDARLAGHGGVAEGADF